MKLPKATYFCNSNNAFLQKDAQIGLAHFVWAHENSPQISSNDNDFLTIPLENRVGQIVNVDIKPGYICIAGSNNQQLGLIKYLNNIAVKKNVCLWELDARRFALIDNKQLNIANAYFIINVDLDVISPVLFKEISKICKTKFIFKLNH